MLDRHARILVVDDSAVARKIVRGLLYKLNLDLIEEASDGRDALAKLEKKPFALILSDWDMAPMNGLDLLKIVRRTPLWSRIPFILVTAMSHVRFADAARDEGATHYMAKPFTAEDLASRLSKIEQRRVG